MNAEHLAFMGIPIDGNRMAFHYKLSDKGFKFMEDSGKSRYYSGVFNGENVHLIVPYIPSSKKVYAVWVIYENGSKRDISNQFQELRKNLELKYGKRIIQSVSNDFISKNSAIIYKVVNDNNPIGEIAIDMTNEGDGIYGLALMYNDAENDAAAKQANIYDL